MGAIPPKTKGKKRILIAEDEPHIADMLVRVLGREYEVVRATDGATALASASKLPPDLLLTDVMMPTMDGFNLAHKLRMLPGLERVPIVFLTAHDNPTAKIKGIQLGAKHFITKPFVIKDLLARVQSILG